MGLALHLFGLGLGVVECTDVHERAFGEAVAFAVTDAFEAVDRRIQRRVDALEAGELFGNVEGLREEALELAGAGDGEFVIFRKFIGKNNWFI